MTKEIMKKLEILELKSDEALFYTYFATAFAGTVASLGFYEVTKTTNYQIIAYLLFACSIYCGIRSFLFHIKIRKLKAENKK